MLIGRGVARLGVGLAGAVITLGVGVLALGVPFDPAAVDWPLLLMWCLCSGLAPSSVWAS